MKTRIFLDMDGPMVDFEAAACKAHEVTVDHLTQQRQLGQWSMAEALGMEEDYFWKQIKTLGEHFWCGVTPQPWLPELMHLVDSITDDWYVVTAPNQYISSHVGKITWLKRYFGEKFDRFLITRHKHLLAGNGLLIDDRQRNVDKFNKAGGQGLIFPMIGNCLYEYRHCPVEYLTRILEKHYAPQIS